MKKSRLVTLGLFIALVSGFTIFASSQVRRIGPYWVSSNAYDSLTGGQVGGNVVIAINGESTDTLTVGMVVFWSDTNEVSVSATLANYNTIAGVVVGGKLTSDLAKDASGDVGTAAAAPGQRVILLKQGRAWMKLGQNAAVIAGRKLVPSDSVQGSVDTMLTAAVIDTHYRYIGRNIKAAGAVSAILVDVNIK